MEREGNKSRDSGFGRQGGFNNRQDGGSSRPGGFNNRRPGGPKKSFNNGPKEMHKATCTECGNDCEVPFKPSGEKPVFCRNCFQKHRPPRD